MPGFAQGEENRKQAFDFGQVEAGGGLVEEVEGRPAGAGGQGGGEADALGLAPGEAIGRLPDGQVTEADLLQGLECQSESRYCAK